MKELDFVDPRPNAPVQDHNLAVTRWTNIPSVLIEAAPTSSEMNNISKHNAIADKIIQALEIYFKAI